MAADPYALTLWTFYQSEEAAMFARLVREDERLDLANMITLGFIEGTGPINRRIKSLDAKTRAPVTAETREDMSRRADELWAVHMGSRPRLAS